MRDLKEKQEREAVENSEIQSVDVVIIHCKSCNQLVCHAQDLRRFKDAHHVVINRDIYDRMDVKDHKKPKTIDGIFFGKKVMAHYFSIFLSVFLLMQLLRNITSRRYL
jgi:tRNA-dihydrouridine synthase